MERLVEKKWLVVYTKSRGEKKLLLRLLARNIEAYCPMHKTLRQWSDRKKMVTVPVFASYVFVRVCEKERLRVLQDPLAVRFLYWLGEPAVIRDKDMASLQKFLSEYSNIQLKAIDLKSGNQVEIMDGPFKGERAVVSHIEKNKVRLCLEQIGYRLVAEVPRQHLMVS